MKNKIMYLVFILIGSMFIFMENVNAKTISDVELGQYINYYPSETTHTTSNTGTTASTINPSELTSWRVLKINEDNTVEIVSTNVSTNSIKFSGTTGYRNYVNELQNAAKTYINPVFAQSARSFGFDGQTLILPNSGIYNEKYTKPWGATTSNNNNETSGGGDVLYKKDFNQMSTASISLGATKVKEETNSGYYVASRKYTYFNDYSWYFDIRYCNNGLYSTNLRYYESFDLHTSTRSYSIRPIVTLKSNLELTGTGTVEDPYKLILYNIEFNSNEGSNVDKQYVYEVNSKTTKPTDPIKEGHIFKGWYKAEDLTEQWNFDNDVVSNNITLYAKWEKEEYDVKFELNGHSQTINDQTIAYGDRANKPSNPISEGYIFEGWYTDEELTNKYDFDSPVTQNIILYAKWTENKEVNEENDNNVEENQEVSKKEDNSNPQTSDNIISWVIFGLIFTSGFISITIYKKRR